MQSRFTPWRSIRDLKHTSLTPSKKADIAPASATAGISGKNTALTDIVGLETGTSALKACGMQQELAAHLAMQCSAMGVIIILRAGSPPVYNYKRGPKSGVNLSKTSNQGLFKGSIAAERRFNRINNGRGIVHHQKDADHLTLPIDDPNHQYTVALPISIQDILREIEPDGDLQFLGYEDGLLRLRYKDGKGDFNGQFVINLIKGTHTSFFYSRPWDDPKNHPKWDPLKLIITKPVTLEDIPDSIYNQLFNQVFTVGYVNHRGEIPSSEVIFEAKVFANTPKTVDDMLSAIQAIKIVDSDDNATALKEIKKIWEELSARMRGDALFSMPLVSDDCSAAIAPSVTTSSLIMSDLLQKELSPEQIKLIYDDCALVVTGDWDGLALGQPLPEFFTDTLLGFPAGYPKDQMRIYNTFGEEEQAMQERAALREASWSYVGYLKEKYASHADTQFPFYSLLMKITESYTLFSELAIQRAGCITPHEFVFQQLINFTYRDIHNDVYGEQSMVKELQSSFSLALQASDLTASPNTRVAQGVECTMQLLMNGSSSEASDSCKLDEALIHVPYDDPQTDDALSQPLSLASLIMDPPCVEVVRTPLKNRSPLAENSLFRTPPRKLNELSDTPLNTQLDESANETRKRRSLSETPKRGRLSETPKRRSLSETPKRRSLSGTPKARVIEQHVSLHFAEALKTNAASSYVIPHPDYDHNVHDLFQHGFDMRNPYGSNLEGSWLMITNDGMTVYGDTQEKLVETLMSGTFLQDNIFDVSCGADMNVWGRVIAKQREFGQLIPGETLAKYEKYSTPVVEAVEINTGCKP